MGFLNRIENVLIIKNHFLLIYYADDLLGILFSIFYLDGDLWMRTLTLGLYALTADLGLSWLMDFGINGLIDGLYSGYFL